MKFKFILLATMFALFSNQFICGESLPFKLTNFRAFPIRWYSEYGLISGNKAYITASENQAIPSSLYEINIADGRISNIFPYWLLARNDSNFLVDGLDKHLYYFDPANNQKRLVPNDNLLYQHSTGIIVPYRNDIFYASVAVSEDVSNLARFDLRNGTIKNYHLVGYPYATAPDRMHMLVAMQGGLAIWDLDQDRPVIVSQEALPGASQIAYFISNEYFIVHRTQPQQLEVWNIDGKTKELIPIETDDGWLLNFMWFSDDLNTVFAEMQWADASGNSVRRAGFLDSSALGQYMSQHFRFRPKDGILNDSNVRVRESPNLQAEVLGNFTRGDGVKVTDRSSLKVQIGALSDYWYKIRATDGLEGWIYGVYLNILKDVVH